MIHDVRIPITDAFNDALDGCVLIKKEIGTFGMMSVCRRTQSDDQRCNRRDHVTLHITSSIV